MCMYVRSSAIHFTCVVCVCLCVCLYLFLHFISLYRCILFCVLPSVVINDDDDDDAIIHLISSHFNWVAEDFAVKRPGSPWLWPIRQDSATYFLHGFKTLTAKVITAIVEWSNKSSIKKYTTKIMARPTAADDRSRLWNRLSTTVHLTDFPVEFRAFLLSTTRRMLMAHSRSFVGLAFQNGLEYRNADGRVNSGDDLATSCGNLVP